MPRNPVITQTEYNELRRKGWTPGEIGTATGLSRQRVSQIKYEGASVFLTPREEAMEHFPFEIQDKSHTRATHYIRLTEHMWYMQNQGKDMPQYRVDRVVGWQKMLRKKNLVLVYDPSIPPPERDRDSRKWQAVPALGGWEYVTRTEADGDLVVRVKKEEELSREAQFLLTLPAV